MTNLCRPAPNTDLAKPLHTNTKRYKYEMTNLCGPAPNTDLVEPLILNPNLIRNHAAVHGTFCISSQYVKMHFSAER